MLLRPLCSVVALIALGTAGSAFATPITFTSSGTAAGNPVTASATFSFSGDLLTIVLANTSPSHSGHDKPGSTLTGLFFDLTGSPTLSADSATVSAGSSIVQGSSCSPTACTSATTNLDGEFGYNINGADGNSYPSGLGAEGIASSGYLKTGLPHNIGNFNNGSAGTDLDGQASLDGIDFGIVSDNYADPNGGLTGRPLVQNSVTFVLDNASGLSPADISNVSFQYGTSFSEANIPGTPGTPVPEPGELGLFVLGLVGAFFGYRRLRRGC